MKRVSESFIVHPADSARKSNFRHARGLSAGSWHSATRPKRRIMSRVWAHRTFTSGIGAGCPRPRLGIPDSRAPRKPS